jgi:CMP-N-acetylneuraminic acid synthetase
MIRNTVGAPYVLGAVFARGGSKGVPRKNARMLGGKPLLAHSVEAALAATCLDRVIVSTDDDELAAIARQYGAEVPFVRPSNLATDESSEWSAWQHAIRAMSDLSGRDVDVLVSVSPTSPFRSPADIDLCYERLKETDADIVVTVTPAARSPYFNMVVLEGDRARLVIPPLQSLNRRQDTPEVYDMTTVAYAARAPFVLDAQYMFSGRVSAVIVPAERALDIDSEFDFRIAEMIVRSRQ